MPDWDIVAAALSVDFFVSLLPFVVLLAFKNSSTLKIPIVSKRTEYLCSTSHLTLYLFYWYWVKFSNATSVSVLLDKQSACFQLNNNVCIGRVV